MAAYLTREQYAARTGTVLADAPSLMELRLASDAVDASGPFTGLRYVADQERAFPRTHLLPGDTENVVPERVLDAVALLAVFEASPEVSAAVKSQSDLDSSITYETAVVPDAIRRVGLLLAPYQRRNGRVL